VGSQYQAKIRDRKIFEVRKVSEGYVFLPLVPDLSVETSSGPLDLAPGQVRILDHTEICQTVIRWGIMNWIFSSFENVAIPTLTTKGTDAEWGVFKKSLGISAAAIAVLAGIALLWPKEKAVEVVPPQFTKISTENRATARPTQKSSATNTRRSVTQAFRAQALQSAANGLLKGGMTKLLQQSQFVMGSENSEAARALLKATSQGLVSTAPATGLMKSKSISVASIGGSGLGASGREQVGYGTGDHAAVTGQGKSFFTLDTGASNVEEGLTKDEVGEVIHRHISEIRYCYEAAMVRTADVEGKLTIGFTISGIGAVKTADIRSSTLTDPGLDDCVLRRLSNWKFPQTKGGIDVAVNYPFIFKSLGR
jgi:TonB family protein